MMGGFNPMMIGGSTPMIMGGYNLVMMGGYRPMMMAECAPTTTGTLPAGLAPPPVAAFTTPATPSNAGAAERKDFDPPPLYDGSDPVKTFPAWRRLFVLWMRDADIPFRRRGRNILQSINGDPLAVAGTLTDEELLCEDAGEDAGFLILQNLDEAYGVHLMSRLPLGEQGVRNKGKTMLTYTAVKRMKFVELRQKGCDLPDIAQGLIALRMARLSERVSQDVRMWLQGRYSLADIVTALTRLETFDVGGNKNNSYFVSDDEEFFYEEYQDMTLLQRDRPLRDLPESWRSRRAARRGRPLVLVNYAQVRAKLYEKRMNRGYYPTDPPYWQERQEQGQAQGQGQELLQRPRQVQSRGHQEAHGMRSLRSGGPLGARVHQPAGWPFRRHRSRRRVASATRHVLHPRCSAKLCIQRHQRFPDRLQIRGRPIQPQQARAWSVWPLGSSSSGFSSTPATRSDGWRATERLTASAAPPRPLAWCVSRSAWAAPRAPSK